MPEPSHHDAATAWYVDCHVHVHDAYPRQHVIAGAFAALRRAAGVPMRITGALCIVDARGQRGFEELKQSSGDWTVQETAEPASFLIRNAEDVIAVLAGRQAATAERLEVLLLGSAAQLPDGEKVERTLARARAANGVPVVPWGFGKWTFARSRIVSDLITRGSGFFALGDTGNRPQLLEPREFSAARERGIPILPGSDPLTLASHAARAGTCGVRLDCVPDLERPAEQIVGLLLRAVQPATFCTRPSLARFLIDQTRIRMSRISRTPTS